MYFLFYSLIPCFLGDHRLVFKLAHGGDPLALVRYGCSSISKVGSFHVCHRDATRISSLHVIALSRTDYRIRSAFLDGKTIHTTRLQFNDPGYQYQSLYSGQYDPPGAPGYTHNLYKLWERGITGEGIVVAVVDDGVDRHHEDLKDNYDPHASYDFVLDNEDPNTEKEIHGTKCIGLISSVANNGICGVGAAYKAKFGAIKILAKHVGSVFDSIEAQAFRFRPDYISIYSMSWGPLDDGMKVAKPHALAAEAIKNGAISGRKGLGSIYVWASGNGGRNFDFCGFDGYLQQYEVLVVGSTTFKGKMPIYAERCTAILTSTLSNPDNIKANKIFATLPNNICDKNHTGTSVSAPILSAILALLLQVKSEITTRDIQSLLVRTSLQVDKYPIINAVGLKYSLNFGFGLVQAEKLIDAATSKDFKPLPPLAVCQSPIFEDNQEIHSGGRIQSVIYMSGCLDTDSALDTIEVVIVTLSIDASSRNALTAFLISPSGTRVPILEPRLLDTSDEGLEDWDVKVMTFYGEKAYGIWTLEINMNRNEDARLESWGLRLYGTLNSNESSISYLTTKGTVCSEDNYKKDSGIKEWCSGQNAKHVRSNGYPVDGLSYIDSYSVFQNKGRITGIILYISVLFLVVGSITGAVVLYLYSRPYIRAKYYSLLSN